MREQLWRYYPQFLDAVDVVVDRLVLANRQLDDARHHLDRLVRQLAEPASAGDPDASAEAAAGLARSGPGSCPPSRLVAGKVAGPIWNKFEERAMNDRTRRLTSDHVPRAARHWRKRHSPVTRLDTDGLLRLCCNFGRRR